MNWNYLKGLVIWLSCITNLSYAQTDTLALINHKISVADSLIELKQYEAAAEFLSATNKLFRIYSYSQEDSLFFFENYTNRQNQIIDSLENGTIPDSIPYQYRLNKAKKHIAKEEWLLAIGVVSSAYSYMTDSVKFQKELDQVVKQSKLDSIEINDVNNLANVLTHNIDSLTLYKRIVEAPNLNWFPYGGGENWKLKKLYSLKDSLPFNGVVYWEVGQVYGVTNDITNGFLYCYYENGLYVADTTRLFKRVLLYPEIEKYQPVLVDSTVHKATSSVDQYFLCALGWDGTNNKISYNPDGTVSLVYKRREGQLPNDASAADKSITVEEEWFTIPEGNSIYNTTQKNEEGEVVYSLLFEINNDKDTLHFLETSKAVRLGKQITMIEEWLTVPDSNYAYALNYTDEFNLSIYSLVFETTPYKDTVYRLEIKNGQIQGKAIAPVFTCDNTTHLFSTIWKDNQLTKFLRNDILFFTINYKLQSEKGFLADIEKVSAEEKFFCIAFYPYGIVRDGRIYYYVAYPKVEFCYSETTMKRLNKRLRRYTDKEYRNSSGL